MLNGRLYGTNDRIGSGTILWHARDLHAAGEIDDDKLVEMIAAGYVYIESQHFDANDT